MTTELRRKLAVAMATGLLTAAPLLYAHMPLCDCFDEGGGTIVCEGGFADGASAAGLPIRVVDEQQKILLEGKMDESATFTFQRPDIDVFIVVFDGGEEHKVEVFSDDIY